MTIERARLIKSCLPLLSILFTLRTFAQDSPQWKLPEGAAMRLGKGALTGPVAYSPDGARLAVASSLGIWFYDTTTFQEIALLDESTAWVENLAFSPDGSTLATVRWDGIYLWDAVTGAHKQTLEVPSSALLSLAFSPDGGNGWRPGVLRARSIYGMWFRASICMRLKGMTGWCLPVAFSRDGKTLASGSSSEIRLWDVQTGAHKQTLEEGHTWEVHSVAYSPDGNYTRKRELGWRHSIVGCPHR